MLTKLAGGENVDIRVKVRGKLKDARTLEELNAALKELGLTDEFGRE